MNSITVNPIALDGDIHDWSDRRDHARGGPQVPAPWSPPAGAAPEYPGRNLVGVEPLETVKYQILVLFLITAGTTFGLMAAVIGGARRLTDGRHRLRHDRLTLAPT